MKAYYDSEEYRQSKARLKDNYAKYFDKIETYIQLTGYIDLYKEEDCLYQIMDDLLSAQKEGKPAVLVTGADLVKYCNTMIDTEKSRSKVSCRNIIIFITLIIFTILLMAILKAVFIINENEDGRFLTDRLHNMNIGIAEAALGAFYLMIFRIKRCIAKTFFNNTKISRRMNKLIRILIAMGSPIYIQVLHFSNFNVGIPIPLTAFIVLMIFCIIMITIYLIKYNKKPSDDWKSKKINE